MFYFGPITARVQTLRTRYRDEIPTMDSERTRIVTDYYRKHQNQVPILKRAGVLYELLTNMTVRVENDELLVANTGKYFHNCPLIAEYKGIEWLCDELRSGEFDKRTVGDGYAIMEKEDRDYFCNQEVVDYWNVNSLSAALDANLPEGFERIAAAGALPHTLKGNGQSPHGHFNANYKKAVDEGFGAIRQDAISRLEALKGRLCPSDVEKMYFYQAVVVVCDGIIKFSKRYAAECLRLALSEKNKARKSELLKMAESLDWIMENPARTYYEALQCILLYHFVLTIDGNVLGLTIGRIDQQLGNYLENDLKENRISLEQAQELMDCFFIKMSELCLAAPKLFMHFFGAYTSNQRLTLSGRKRDGSDATNQVTYLCLQSAGRLLLHDPTLSLCLHKDSPPELVEAGLKTVQRVGGIPTFENTDLIIDILLKQGLSLEDARNFCIVGCVEISGSGCEFGNISGPFSRSYLNINNVLLQAINNGVNPMNGAKSGLDTGNLNEMTSFAQVIKAFREQTEFFLDWQHTIYNIQEDLGNYLMPLPAASATIDGCMEKGRDMVYGGAKYNSTCMSCHGVGTLVDSLCAIKYLVFDKKLCTASELLSAIRVNWEGYEDLRMKAELLPPKYGNGDPEADEIANWFSNLFSNRVTHYRGKRGGYRAGIYSAGGNLITGYGTWATPNGRKARDVVSDGASPTHGADKCGPTGVVKSIWSLEPKKYANGVQFCLRLHPSCVSGEDSIEKFRGFLAAFFANGGTQLQVNILDSDTLRQAKENPDEYRDLVVRVAGFSAYFVELHEDLQNDIILRTDNML